MEQAFSDKAKKAVHSVIHRFPYKHKEEKKKDLEKIFLKNGKIPK